MVVDKLVQVEDWVLVVQVEVRDIVVQVEDWVLVVQVEDWLEVSGADLLFGRKPGEEGLC